MSEQHLYALEQLRQSPRMPGDMEIFDAFREDSIEGVLRLFYEEMSAEIDAQSDETHSEQVSAYNRVTQDWPFEARAAMADFEAQTPVGTRSESYLEDVADFAEYAEVEWNNLPESDTYYPNDLTEIGENFRPEAAWAIIYSRAVAGDVNEPFLDDVGPDQFIDAVRETSNVHAAIDRQRYSMAIPTDILSELAAPDEWPDGMDAQDVSSSFCSICHDEFLHVYTEDDGAAWFSPNNANRRGVVAVQEEPDWEVIDANYDLLCQSCADSVENGPEIYIHAPEQGVNFVGVVTENAAIHDDESEASIENLSPNTFHDVRQASRGVPDGYFAMDLTPNFGSTREVVETAKHILTPPVELSGGPIILVDGEHERRIVLPRDDSDVVHEFKEEIALRMNATEQIAGA